MIEIIKEIKLLIFSSKTDTHLESLANSIPDFFPKNQFFHFSDAADFSLALRDLLLGLGIVLIVVRSKKEMEQIFQIRQRLSGHSVILILDDSIDETAHQVLQLYPRYTCYLKKSYRDIFLILKKMITKIQKNIKGGTDDRGDQQH